MVQGSRFKGSKVQGSPDCLERLNLGTAAPSFEPPNADCAGFRDEPPGEFRGSVEELKREWRSAGNEPNPDCADPPGVIRLIRVHPRPQVIRPDRVRPQSVD